MSQGNHHLRSHLLKSNGLSPDKQLQMRQLAHDLVAKGLKVTFVNTLTHQQTKWIRSLHKHIHGEDPRGGQQPHSAARWMTNDQHTHELGVGLSLYMAVARQYDRQIPRHAEYFIKAHNLCQAFLRPDIDINALYFAVRDFQIGALTYRECMHCHARYLRHDLDNRREHCPYCASRASKSGPSAPPVIALAEESQLAPVPKGLPPRRVRRAAENAIKLAEASANAERQTDQDRQRRLIA